MNWIQAYYSGAAAGGSCPNVTHVNHNKLLKMRQFIGIYCYKITWKMSENHCSHLENKLLLAKTWQRYVF